MPGCHRVSPGQPVGTTVYPQGSPGDTRRSRPRGRALHQDEVPVRQTPKGHSRGARGNTAAARLSRDAARRSSSEPAGTTVGRQGGSAAPNRDDGGVLLTASGPGRRQCPDDSVVEMETGNHRGQAGGFTGMAKTGRNGQFGHAGVLTSPAERTGWRHRHHRRRAGECPPRDGG